MLASILKTVYLETSIVRFGSFFQNPVTNTLGKNFTLHQSTLQFVVNQHGHLEVTTVATTYYNVYRSHHWCRRQEPCT